MATPTPISTIRNCTIGETSATAVKARSGTNAISKGTTASTDAKTKTRTNSAPKPPITASSSTQGPSLSPLSSVSASNPVTRTGSPATVTP
jgi:predicted ribonuclease toxin of YeeF-YezG toxin-antitoxin module